jgi:hypothetical protein
MQTSRLAELKGSIEAVAFFFFQKKKQKAFVLLRRRSWAAQTSAKPTLGVWGRAPKRLFDYSSNSLLHFPEKEAKSVCSASQKVMGCPNLGEADPGGLGACPQETIRRNQVKAKSAELMDLFPGSMKVIVYAIKKRGSAS